MCGAVGGGGRGAMAVWDTASRAGTSIVLRSALTYTSGLPAPRVRSAAMPILHRKGGRGVAVDACKRVARLLAFHLEVCVCVCVCVLCVLACQRVARILAFHLEVSVSVSARFCSSSPPFFFSLRSSSPLRFGYLCSSFPAPPSGACAPCVCVCGGGGGGVDENLRAGIDWNGVGSGNHLLVDPDSVEETTVQLGPVVKVGLRVVTVVLAPRVSGRTVCGGGGALGGEFVC